MPRLLRRWRRPAQNTTNSTTDGSDLKPESVPQSQDEVPPFNWNFPTIFPLDPTKVPQSGPLLCPNFSTSCLPNIGLNSYPSSMADFLLNMVVTPQASHSTAVTSGNSKITTVQGTTKTSHATSTSTIQEPTKASPATTSSIMIPSASTVITSTSSSQSETIDLATQTSKNSFHEPLQFINLFHLDPDISIRANKLKLLHIMQEKPKPEFDQEKKDKIKSSKLVCLTNLPPWFEPKHILLLILLSTDFNITRKDYELIKQVKNGDGFNVAFLLFANNKDCLNVFYGLHKVLSLEIATDFGVLLDFEIAEQLAEQLKLKESAVIRSGESGEKHKQTTIELNASDTSQNKLKEINLNIFLEYFSVNSSTDKLTTHSNGPDSKNNVNKSNDKLEVSNLDNDTPNNINEEIPEESLGSDVAFEQDMSKTCDEVQSRVDTSLAKGLVNEGLQNVEENQYLPKSALATPDTILCAAEKLLQRWEITEIDDLTQHEPKDSEVDSITKQKDDIVDTYVASQITEEGSRNENNGNFRSASQSNNDEMKEKHLMETFVSLSDNKDKNVDVVNVDNRNHQNAYKQIGIEFNNYIELKNSNENTAVRNSPYATESTEGEETWDNNIVDNDVVLTTSKVKEVYVKNLPTFQTLDIAKSLVKERTNFNTTENYFFINFIKEGECLLRLNSHEDAVLVCRNLNNATVKGKKIEANMFSSFGHDSPTDLSSKTWELVDLRKPNIAPRISVRKTYGLNKMFLAKLGIITPMKNVIIVKNLHYKVDETKIREIFSMAGEIKQLEINRYKDKNEARIDFDHPVEAVQAISMFNKHKLFGKEMDVAMESSVHEKPLPVGLSSIGIGLGKKGKPIKNVRANIEYREMCEIFWELGIMSKVRSTSNPFENHYVRRVIKNGNKYVSRNSGLVSDNMSNQAANTAKHAKELAVRFDTLGAVMKSQSHIPSNTDCRELLKLLEVLDNQEKITTTKRKYASTHYDSETEGETNWKKNKTYDMQHTETSNMSHNFAEAALKYRLNKKRRNRLGSSDETITTPVKNNVVACSTQHKFKEQIKASNKQLTSPSEATNVEVTLKTKLSEKSEEECQTNPHKMTANENLSESKTKKQLTSSSEATDVDDTLKTKLNKKSEECPNKPLKLTANEKLSELKTELSEKSEKECPNNALEMTTNENIRESARKIAKKPKHSRRKKSKASHQIKEPHKKKYFKAQIQNDSDLITNSWLKKTLLIFRNLPPSVTPKLLERKVKEVGDLLFVTMIETGRAVVCFEDATDADRCFRYFHQSSVDGHVIDVTYM